MGDLILSTPAIRAVRAAYPRGYLALLVQPANRALVEGHPALDEVILFDKEKAHRGWKGAMQLAWLLRSRRFDLAVLLHTTTRVVLLTWLAGIRYRVGFARRLGVLLTHGLPYQKRQGTQHEVDYTLDLVRAVGIPADDRTLAIAWQAAGEESVRAWLARQGIAPGDPLFLFHPGASCPSKRWPAERFAAVADQLWARFPAGRWVVIVGPGEEPWGRAVVLRSRAPLILSDPPLTLAELPWLLKRASCLVSNDSGPVHVASAVGTPSVVVFGRWGGGLSPTRWGPTHPRSIVLHRDVGCRPCLAHRCKIGFACLEAVLADEVAAAVERLVSSQGKAV